MDPPLSEAGRAQAHRLAQALASLPLRAVYTSPLSRAMETARSLASAHRLDVIPVADLREIGAGVWESLLIEEIQERYGALLQQWWNAPDEVRVPGGETLEELRARGVAAFEDIRRRHLEEAVAIVAHGGVNKTILLTLLGAPLASYWRIRQSNACINVIEFDGNQARILMMNETTYLK